MVKERYFVARCTVKKVEGNDMIVGESSNHGYLWINHKTNKVEWNDTPKKGNTFSFIAGFMIILILRIKNKEADREYSLESTGDVAFTHYVTTGEKLQ